MCRSNLPENATQFFGTGNILAEAIHTAFYHHYPLCLSPDVIWITIVQGLSYHVNLNSEKYRNFFVDFEGKKDISICRANFVKGSSNNDWAGVFPEFASEIAKHIGKEKVEIIDCNFSTTTGVERIASQIALMDAVSSNAQPSI